MGRSLRSAKRTRPKVSVRPKKTKFQKSKPPADLQGQALKAKLQLGCVQSQQSCSLQLPNTAHACN